MMRFRTLLVILILLLVVAWLVLYVSSKGILVHSEGPVQKADQPVEVLVCTYFTGTGVLKKEYWYGGSGPIGSLLNGVLTHTVCPRLIEL